MWKISHYPSLVLPATAVARLGEVADIDLEICGLSEREAYLDFVASWKLALKELVASIREQKALRRVGDDEERSWAQMRREILRAEARAMFRLRRVTKAASAEFARRARAI